MHMLTGPLLAVALATTAAEGREALGHKDPVYDRASSLAGGHWAKDGRPCMLVVLGQSDKPGTWRVRTYNEFRPTPLVEDMIYVEAHRLLLRSDNRVGVVSRNGTQIDWMFDATVWRRP